MVTVSWGYQVNKCIASHQMHASLLLGFSAYMKHTSNRELGLPA
jgi:hypothetical protein